MDGIYPGSMLVASNGTIGFEASPYSMGGMGFEIKYKCPVEEPCEDIKSTKWCKKQKKKGKCKEASVWKNCQSTCEKCDSKGQLDATQLLNENKSNNNYKVEVMRG